MNVILSIKPHYVKEIVSGNKRYEFRKRIFKQSVVKVYIYETAPVSKIIGEFQPVDVLQGPPEEIWQKTKRYSGIKKENYDHYYSGKSTAFAIEIKNLQIYEKPKNLPFHAPQSYRYIDAL